MRMKHRYDLTMDAQDYDFFCEQFKTGNIQGGRPDDKGHIEGWIKFKDVWVCMSYVPSMQLVGTIMPCPPALVFDELAKRAAKDAAKPLVAPAWLEDEKRINQQIGERAKKMAYTLFDQAMSAGKAPKWLQKHMVEDDGVPVNPKMQRKAEAVVAQRQATRTGMDPEVKKADIAWFKTTMDLARKLLKAGKILEAGAFLDAVASLPGSFHPSAQLEEAERLVTDLIAAESVWWSKHFELNGYPKVLESTKGLDSPRPSLLTIEL